MKSISLKFIINATQGRLINACYNMKIKSICTDSRNVTPGCLYIALKGERFDGHDFIRSAFEKGAAAALSERETDCSGKPLILVQNTGRALLELAQAYRQLFSIPVVGITGSVGKTSTKEMVYAVLSQKYLTHKNEGNLNNEIGLPKSVFGLETKHQAAVFEMGMSAFGEISRLSQTAAPGIGIITNIGISHIEKLGSRENIFKAKMELLDGLKPDGTLILNGDDEFLSQVSSAGERRILQYGIEKSGCDAIAEEIRTEEGQTFFELRYKGEKYPAMLPTVGRHHVYNALAAFLTGVSLQIEPQEAIAGFLNYETSGMRQKIVHESGITFIEDCYNASPDSMSAAFSVLDTVNAERRIAVLADMLELGLSSRQAHLNVGKLAAFHADQLFCFGQDARYYCEGYQGAGKSPADCHYYTDQKEMAEAVSAALREGDAVLYKGSRGMKLENTIHKVYEVLKGGN